MKLFEPNHSSIRQFKPKKKFFAGMVGSFPSTIVTCLLPHVKNGRPAFPTNRHEDSPLACVNFRRFEVFCYGVIYNAHAFMIFDKPNRTENRMNYLAQPDRTTPNRTVFEIELNTGNKAENLDILGKLSEQLEPRDCEWMIIFKELDAEGSKKENGLLNFWNGMGKVTVNMCT